MPVHEQGQSQLSQILQAQPPSDLVVPLGLGCQSAGEPTSASEARTGNVSAQSSSPALPASLSPVHGQQPLSGEALRRLSESLPQQVQMSASPDAFGDASWHHVGLQLAGAPYRGSS